MKAQASGIFANIELAHRRKRNLAAFLAVLALFVAIFVVWELKITGISMAGDANVSDSNADVETAAQWESTLPALGDDWLENTADIALSQVGYKESTLNFVTGDDGKTPQGYTRYGAWYGTPYADWDAIFASFCLHYAGVSSTALQHSNSAYSWANALSAAGSLMDPATYDPQVGDVAFFDEDGDGREDTVAIVVDAASNGTLTYVQGDKDGEVKRFASTSSIAPAVASFGQMPQNPAVVAAKQAAEEAAAADASAGNAEGTEGEGAEGSSASGAAADGSDAAAAGDGTVEGAAGSSAAAAGSSGAATAGATGSATASTTDPNKTTIAVCADWAEGSEAKPQSVNVTLLKDGDFENPVKTIALTAANNYEGAFANVDLYDANEEAVSYNVVSSVVDGFDTELSVATVSTETLDSAVKANSNLAEIAKSAEDVPAENDNVSAVEETAVSASEEGGNLSSERAGLMLLSYTPATYASTTETRAATVTVPLTITKEWSDGNSAHAGESVTVSISGTYSDGTSWNMGQATISAPSWTKTVDIPTNGKTIASCNVSESSIDGYDSYVEDVAIDAREVWVPVSPSEINNNDVYAITYKSSSSSSYVWGLYDTGSTSISSSYVEKGTGTVTVDGKEYYDYLTSVDSDQQWRIPYISSGTYAGYRAAITADSYGTSSQRYIYEQSSGYYNTTYSFVMKTGSGAPLAFNSNKTIQAADGHYLMNASGSTTSSYNATQYTLYKKATAVNSMSTVVHNRKVASINDSATSVSVKKQWLDSDGRVDNGSHEGESVTIHLTNVDQGGVRVQSASSVVLSSDNNWEANDVWTNLVEGTYSVEEDSVPGYNASIQSEQSRRTIWIPVDDFENGGIYAIVDNGTGRFMESMDPTAGTDTTNLGALKAISLGTVASKNSSPVYFGDKTYRNYIDSANVPSAAQWTALEQSNAYALQSVAQNQGDDGAWIAWYGNFLNTVSNAKSSSMFTYDSSTGMLKNSGKAIGSLAYYGTYYYGYSGSYRPFTLYKQVTLVERTFTVVNSPAAAQTGSSADFDVEHNKYIDALRDGQSNPDTSFAQGTDLTDMYRLYLDAGPTDFSEPVDLLLVLDDSGSMGNNNTTLNGKSMTRTAALKQILTGSDGVISRFLDSNSQNRVAVVRFAGATPVYSTSWGSDASVISSWSRTTPSLDSLASSGGTDYSAGLLKAQQLFQNNTSGHKQVMVFLSDGVPTFYVGEDGVRHGHGMSDLGNATLCIEPSKDSFDRFMAACPNVTTYTVGFSADIAGNASEVTTNPAVLRYYAEEGGGMFIQANNADTLNDQLAKLVLGGGMFTNASISDTLSDAVDLYDEQPDYKVVMQKVSNGQTVGQPVVLWNNGGAQKQYTDDLDEGKSKDIVIGVSYDAASRTVTATFDPNYAMDPEYRYTVSFNVRTTNKAYVDYANDRANGGDGYNGMTGDDDTDYSPYTTRVENDTSSGHLGFRSNTTAQLYFKRGNSYYSMAYDHPVIQVSDCSFDIKKVDVDNQNTLLGGAKFSVYREARAGETVWHVDGLEGDYYRVATDLVTQGGTVSVKHLEPGTYWVVEDAPPSGYTKDATPHEITLTRDSIVVGPGDTTAVFEGNTNGHLVLQITNKPGYSLPQTGGIGDRPFTAAGLILVATSLAFGCVLARRRSERRLGRASLQRR